MDKNIWFSSDLHLGHQNIIKYANRPFGSVEKMDDVLIYNHNSLVLPTDDWYFLGDFSFNDKKTESYLQRLNGNKFFLRGNHDRKQTVKLYEKYGTYLGDYWQGELDGHKYVLCHYAFRVWNGSHRSTYHLYGHSHGTLPDIITSFSFDCGVDCHNYRPISTREVEDIMSGKEFIPIDHHNKRN